MSRVRTGPRPEDWREEEPGSAHVVSRGGVLAVGVSAQTQARLATKARKGSAVVPNPCGAWMAKAKAPCARSKGHNAEHLSRPTLDHAAARRRARNEGLTRADVAARAAA